MAWRRPETRLMARTQGGGRRLNTRSGGARLVALAAEVEALELQSSATEGELVQIVRDLRALAASYQDGSLPQVSIVS
jgi:hypothetical protein